MKNTNMENKKISIIVPVYNSEKYLNRCISSILNQTYSNFELILINDGSIDNSYLICKSFEKFDDRIKVFNQNNFGASKARNLGINESSGDFIMFVDSDDWIENNMLEVLVNSATQNNADMVICNMLVEYYDRNESLVSLEIAAIKDRVILNKADIATNIIDLVETEKISGPCCKLIKAKLIKNNEIFMPEHITLQEDLYFILNVLEHVNKLVVLDEYYYHYHKGIETSVTSKYYPNKVEMTIEVHNLLLNFYSKYCNDNEILRRVNFILVKNLYAAFINLFHVDCKLSKKEKYDFIENIINTKTYFEIIKNAYRIGFKYHLLKHILTLKNKYLLYYFSKTIYILKFRFGFKY